MRFHLSSFSSSSLWNEQRCSSGSIHAWRVMLRPSTWSLPPLSLHGPIIIPGVKQFLWLGTAGFIHTFGSILDKSAQLVHPSVCPSRVHRIGNAFCRRGGLNPILCRVPPRWRAADFSPALFQYIPLEWKNAYKMWAKGIVWGTLAHRGSDRS